jgi:N-methylhydantoinase A/oxoprolinase/acetone carboxylase beta subunit
VDLGDLGALLDGLESDARAPLALAGVSGGDVSVRRFAEMRYRGQGYELEVPVPHGRPDAAWLAALRAAFEAVYRTYYRHVPSGLPVEAVTWRVRAQSPPPSMPPLRPPDGGPPAPKGERRIWIAAEGGFRTAPVWERSTLTAGWRTHGPAVVEEVESTTIVTPAFDVSVDGGLNLVLSRRPA